MMKILGNVLKNKTVRTALIGLGISAVGLVAGEVVKKVTEKELVEAGCAPEVATKTADRVSVVTYVAVCGIALLTLAIRNENILTRRWNNQRITIKGLLDELENYKMAEEALVNAVVWMAEDDVVEELYSYVVGGQHRILNNYGVDNILSNTFNSYGIPSNLIDKMLSIPEVV